MESVKKEITTTEKFTTIDEYIRDFPAEIQTVLEELRATVKKVVPEAKEKIGYQMPAFTYHGVLVYFAAFKNHIGFYPTPSGTGAFESELKEFKGGKGSVQFPLDKPMPFDLIEKIIKYRAEENLKKSKNKATSPLAENDK